MPQHFFHAQSLSLTTLGAVVGVSYLLSVLALLAIVRDGFRHRSYAMPPLGIVSMLSVCLIAVAGPYSGQSHLFYPAREWWLTAVWGLDAVLLAVILGQYLRYGRPPGQVAGAFAFLVLAQLGIALTGFWSFVAFYQDYYVNEACPLAIFVMSAGYFAWIATGHDLTALSRQAAWLLASSNLLLYGAVVAGNMSDPYPEAEFGYHFIYWMYAVTLAFNFSYAVLLGRRHRARAQAVALQARVV